MSDGPDNDAFAKYLADRDVVARIYEWRHAQAMAGAAGAFALATAILSPLLAAVFDSDADVEVWNTVLIVAGAGLAAVGGFLFRRHARQIQRRYLKAVNVWDPDKEVVLEW